MSESVQRPILITGKNGQVGRELVDLCEAKGIAYVAFDSKELDISDAARVNTVLVKYLPAAVINAAAYTAVDKAESEQGLAYRVNCDGVKNLAIVCNNIDCLLLHISTDYVFDGEKALPYLVADETNPTGVYGASKLAGEKAILDACPKHFIFRVSWVFGQYGNNFVKTMLRLAKERDELGVVNDQYGAPTAAADIAEVILGCVINKLENYGVYHLESNPGVSWYEFANEIFKQAVAQGCIERAPVVKAITADQFPTPARRPSNSKLSSEPNDPFKILGWELGLRKVLQSLQ